MDTSTENDKMRDIDIETTDTNKTTTRYVHGGYSRVSIQSNTKQVVKKMPLYYEQGCLSFNAIVDAIFSRAVSYFDGTPELYKICVDTKSLYLKMPYLGTSLYALSRTLRKKHALQILGDIAKTCIEMERIGLQHTDIKHSNILLSKRGEVCLIDFNICSIKYVNASSLWSPNLGTWEYASPEICLLNIPTNTSVVWSLGVLLCFLYGQHPLHDEMEDHEVDSSEIKQWSKLLSYVSKQNRLGLPLSPALTRAMPVELRKLFHKCTYWDPMLRISLEEFYSVISTFKEYKVQPSVQLPPRLFTMSPLSGSTRDADVDKMYTWCEETKQLHLLCRSIGIYDRLTYYEYDVLNAPACICISYMLTGNYIYLEDPLLSVLAEKFHIQDWSLFLHHIVSICIGLDWDIYELCADVMLLNQIDRVEDFIPMMNTVFSIQRSMSSPYTMRGITKRFEHMLKDGGIFRT
jgi:serine/threonine protein kinase